MGKRMSRMMARRDCCFDFGSDSRIRVRIHFNLYQDRGT